jgi:hypothetical protein
VIKHRLFLALSAFLTLLIFPGCGTGTEKGFADFEPPALPADGRADLVIDGSGIDGPFYLDLEFLMSLPTETFSCVDPWDGKEHSCTGVSIISLLDSCGLSPHATRVTVSAANGYAAPITLHDLRNYTYILACKMDGKTFESAGSLAKRGKLIVALDFSGTEDLDVDVYKHQLVWQVNRIEVE